MKNIITTLAGLSLLVLAGCAQSAPLDQPAAGESTSISGYRVGNNAIYVADQRPGTDLKAQMVVLEKPGYVVVHKDINGAFGDIIGSSPLVQAGTNNNVAIPLSEAMVDGQKFYAMLHTDDGNGAFDPIKDLPLKDVQGNIMHMVFQVTSEAPDQDPVVL